MTTRDILSLLAPSDFLAAWLILLAPLVGMVLIGAPWLWWSKRRKAKRRAKDLATLRNVHVLMVDLAALSRQQRIEGWQTAHRRKTRTRQVIH